ncbi:MAG: hypothetical protein GY925_10255 [Actinomycetia bacterium]|nr:hypothetical protein [Actinomycetes bacterium]
MSNRTRRMLIVAEFWLGVCALIAVSSLTIGWGSVMMVGGAALFLLLEWHLPTVRRTNHPPGSSRPDPSDPPTPPP